MEGGAKIFGVFRVKKITILRQKIIVFPILGVRPPWIRPWHASVLGTGTSFPLPVQYINLVNADFTMGDMYETG